MMNDFRITHIFDDDKFTDMAIHLFESVYPGKSQYYVIKNDEGPYKYVVSELAKAVLLGSPEKESMLIAEIQQSGSKAIFIHALSHKKQQIILKIPSDFVKVWFIWGFDLYSKWKLFNRFLFEKETRSFMAKGKQNFNLTQKLLINRFTFWLFFKSREGNLWLPGKLKEILYRNYANDFYKAAQVFDIVAPVIPTEYELVKSLRIHPRYAPFTYGTLENLLGDKLNDNVLESRNILVGNSASPSNNHVDIFKKLAAFDLKDRKVYVPLSYAGGSEYKEFVLQKGQQLLGKNFFPLVDFMKLERYNEILSECGFLIFNHIRQQGVGNIILLGCMGAKVFLHEKSTVYSFYKDLGIKIFATNQLDFSDIEENLDKEAWRQNRKIYFEHYSTAAVQEKARQLLAIVAEEIHKKTK